MRANHLPIPDDHPVQPLHPETQTRSGMCYCGQCGLWWDDEQPTSMTPAPGGRCPFEAFHIVPPEGTERREHAKMFAAVMVEAALQHEANCSEFGMDIGDLAIVIEEAVAVMQPDQLEHFKAELRTRFDGIPEYDDLAALE